VLHNLKHLVLLDRVEGRLHVHLGKVKLGPGVSSNGQWLLTVVRVRL
jgi:hypothetical protein